ncbi:(d)CMP kinase [candidate division GN15 bacterium]|nr:(d)CMP kinase [candidate division GN15 bacterium]
MTATPDPTPESDCRVIAIDGPAGSGKSTTAKMVAARLGYQYLDTGAMYRALTWHALQHGISPADARRLGLVANQMQIEFETHADINRVFLNGSEVTSEIRTPEVTRQVSEISAHPEVRRAMVEKQKAMGERGCIVAEGRDTTTVVFPDAELKVFLVASVDARAERRLRDLQQMGISSTIEEVRDDLERRDRFDSNREHSPLTRADDAHEVDTTELTIQGQVEHIIELLRQLV